MSPLQFRRAASAAAAVAILTVAVGCSTTTAGTAAVGTDLTTISSTASSTTTATTTRSSRPTTSAETTTSAATTETTSSAMTSTTTALVVGDCYTVATNSDVTAIDCAELHDGQVFQTEVVPTGVDPYETDGGKLFDSAEIDCAAAFEGFTGVPLGSEAAAYTLGLLLTSAPGASTVVACTAVAKNGEPWAGTAESVSGSYRGIGVGDCFDYPTPTADAVKLACDQPHDAEMYLQDVALGVTDPAAPYPTEAEWQALSTTVCLTGFTDYTGLPFDTSTTLSFSYVYPLIADWPDVSQRNMSCIVVEEDGTKLVGSKHS